MHNATGSKLDVWACQGHWIRLDVNTWAYHVYWPGNGNVSVEQNIYLGSSAQLKGEKIHLPSASSELTATPPAPLMPEPTTMPVQPTTPQTLP